MLFELINPSDPYTFRAPSIEVAAVAVVQLSCHMGAKCIDPGCDESTPVMFGWDDWLESRGINGDWAHAHLDEVADALDSFLIGDPAFRADIESAMELIPEDKREQWRLERQDRHRSSMNQIGEAAYQRAKSLREYAAKRKEEGSSSA